MKVANLYQLLLISSMKLKICLALVPELQEYPEITAHYQNFGSSFKTGEH